MNIRVINIGVKLIRERVILMLLGFRPTIYTKRYRSYQLPALFKEIVDPTGDKIEFRVSLFPATNY